MIYKFIGTYLHNLKFSVNYRDLFLMLTFHRYYIRLYHQILMFAVSGHMKGFRSLRHRVPKYKQF